MRRIGTDLEKKAKYNIKWKREHPEQTRRTRHRHEWKGYGLDPRECEAVYESAKNCDICGAAFDGKQQKSLDHNNRTGKVRGVLCGNCNRAIGLLHDDPEFLRQMMVYLEKARLDRGE